MARVGGEGGQPPCLGHSPGTGRPFPFSEDTAPRLSRTWP